ncbi:DgyrCDS10144 [Dimorphilus gyrociliatus]|uniref:DgyrCDS10144 n=1 Tax=Dimorphilus gyrociliatus TaxID=2664684 RepID=A0A7I8W4E5_9ANNE|nr:DgyrCDS10144 [Dimorphilus gyrociliatus]
METSLNLYKFCKLDCERPTFKKYFIIIGITMFFNVCFLMSILLSPKSDHENQRPATSDNLQIGPQNHLEILNTISQNIRYMNSSQLSDSRSPPSYSLSNGDGNPPLFGQHDDLLPPSYESIMNITGVNSQNNNTVETFISEK